MNLSDNESLKIEMLEAIAKTKSMRAAAQACEVPYRTFIYRAKRFGIFDPNQGGVGIVKRNDRRVPLDEIFNGEHPDYSTPMLKKRIIADGRILHECAKCGLTDEWNGKALVLHLEHKNGIGTDHRLDNLEFLCPNCHSQTKTYCKGAKRVQPTDEELLLALEQAPNVRQALLRVGMTPKGTNYRRAYELME